ncbi:MAG: 5-formyltetrahydrofolate cyclo-ligase [Spirochaetia bacterium]
MKHRKRELRKEIRRRISDLSPERAAAESISCAQTLFTLNEWKEAETILTFISMTGEIETTPILERAMAEEKEIALPRMHGDRLEFHTLGTLESLGNTLEGLERHPYGVLEPPADTPLFTSRSRLPAFIVTPGLAFDRSGGRLGRGKGYYDRWFSEHRGLLERGLLTPTAVGYSVQLIDEVPMEEGDVKIPLLVIGGTLIKAF